MDSGEIMLMRDELAELIGTAPNDVSEIMTELESIGAISRRRERVPGCAGRASCASIMSGTSPRTSPAPPRQGTGGGAEAARCALGD